MSPSKPLRTWLIHINPRSWTIYRSFEIILEMGTIHLIGIQKIMFYANLLLQKTF